MERELLVSEPEVEAGDALSGFAHEAGCSEGIAIQSLAPGTTLIVQTRNSQYRVTVLNGDRDSVLVQGGARFSQAKPAHLQGASGGGSLVKTGWIGVGLRMELLVGSDRILTSRVQSIAIENVPPRCSGFQHVA